jgi:hypothetical protein
MMTTTTFFVIHIMSSHVIVTAVNTASLNYILTNQPAHLIQSFMALSCLNCMKLLTHKEIHYVCYKPDGIVMLL